MSSTCELSATWLVSVPVGVGHLIPTEPAVRARAGLVVEANPEGISSAAEQQAVDVSLLEPWRFQRRF